MRLLGHKLWASRCRHRAGPLPSILSSAGYCNYYGQGALPSTATARVGVANGARGSITRRMFYSSSAFASSSPVPSVMDVTMSSPSDDEPHKYLSMNPSSPMASKLNGYSHQRGYGKIVALASQPTTASPISTYLTEIRHSSPMRLVPSRRSPPRLADENSLKRRHEAALLHLSSYGGGLVPGDSLDLDIDVRGQGAVVCILTQGGQRVYRPGEHFRKHGSYSHEAPPANLSSVTEKGASVSKTCASTIKCTVEPGATLFYLPDPTVPYYQSAFKENREFVCQYSPNSDCNQSMGSVIAVDWYSSGRRFSTGVEDERWAFDYLATRSELYVEEQGQIPRKMPALIESMIFDNKLSGSNLEMGRSSASIVLGKTIDSMATLLLHGPSSLLVARRAKALSYHLTGLRTRTRLSYCPDDDTNLEESCGEPGEADERERLVDSLGGDVVLSVTPIKHNKGPIQNQASDPQPVTCMVRILAENNEDIYRTLHYCLKPCSSQLGIEPYRDRIYSSRTVTDKAAHPQQIVNGLKERTRIKPDLQVIANQLIHGNNQTSESGDSEASWFRLCALSDSSLPVGSFAHSLGVEAVSQLGLFRGERDDYAKENEAQWNASNNANTHCCEEALSDYIYAVSRSTAQFSTPLVLSGYKILADSLATDDTEHVHTLWLDIDAYVDSLLLSNEPGHRASVDQGLGLLRVAPSFKGNSDMLDLWQLMRQSIDSSVGNGHAAPIHGALAAWLKIPPLDACRVFAFGATRDSISAAVRLNLIGPMGGLSMLDAVGRGAVEEGLDQSLSSMLSNTSDGCGGDQVSKWLHSAASCAPLLDTCQPIQDLLSTRLFRT